MKIRVRTDKDQLIVYREKSGVIVYSILLAIGCIAFGVTFSYLGKTELFSLIFGILFIIVGTLILLGIPKYYRTMKLKGGAVLLSANKEGLSIAPILNMALAKYTWADISRISLTQKLITKETGEKGYSWNQAIIFFQGSPSKENLSLLERSKSQIWKSPKGSNISIVDVPKTDINQIKEILTGLSPSNCEISIFTRVVFDYTNDSEEFES